MDLTAGCQRKLEWLQCRSGTFCVVVFRNAVGIQCGDGVASEDFSVVFVCSLLPWLWILKKILFGYGGLQCRGGRFLCYS